MRSAGLTPPSLNFHVLDVSRSNKIGQSPWPQLLPVLVSRSNKIGQSPWPQLLPVLGVLSRCVSPADGRERGGWPVWGAGHTLSATNDNGENFHCEHHTRHRKNYGIFNGAPPSDTSSSSSSPPSSLCRERCR